MITTITDRIRKEMTIAVFLSALSSTPVRVSTVGSVSGVGIKVFFVN